MTVEELYERIGGDYGEAIGRLRSEKLVSRFVAKFPGDTSCAELVSAWRNGDRQAAFEAAHMAKGVCANLSLTELARLSSDITEALRPGNEYLHADTDVDALVAELDVKYHVALDAINAFSA